MIPLQVAERAAKKYLQIGDCFISNYSVASHGYAQIGWSENNKTNMTLAHRAAWVFHNGQIPDGMTIDHVCKNKRCVNINHLRILSNFDNARRTNGADWELGKCKNGHPDTELMRVTRKTKFGERRDGLACRICKNEQSREWGKTNNAKRAEIQRKYRARKKEQKF